MAQENAKPNETVKQLYGANSDEAIWLAAAATMPDWEAEIAAARLSVRRLLEAGKDASAAALRVARLVKMHNTAKSQQEDDLLDDDEFDN